ncbi:hypothetical protein [Aquimarina sp. 2201CG5-10]|uniref:hypothetical protein n=1 Tax=Aquimarina callyspongiae TaxID=3098150 RepID=UPI002AB437F9|nr:hypothetical protein [Aquimarina sp. 2201CG5-10]MDY8137245.1 hypothetical protein [Aquimarina sp. 2201CG5-10]
MKKILLLACVVFISCASFAQKGPRERMKAFKVGYITDQLDLNGSEAQKFWPIYNNHEEKVDKLKFKERKLIRSLKEANNGPDGLNDQQAGDFLNQYLETVKTKSQLRQQLIKDLQKVLPNKKILRLIKAEADFNRRLMKQLQERRKRNKQ